jgi:hypothetical protein
MCFLEAMPAGSLLNAASAAGGSSSLSSLPCTQSSDPCTCCESQAQCNASAPFAENAYVAAYNFGNTTRDQFSLTYWCALQLSCCKHSTSYPLIATWCHGRNDNTIQPADVHAQ